MILTMDDINLTDKEKFIFHHTVLENPYIPYKPYPKQALGLLLASREESVVDGVKKPNSILLGAGGFGGKTFLGSMLAVQFLPENHDYTCLVTRRNYAELLDTNSIWENLVDWCCNETLPVDVRCEAIKTPTPKIIAPNGNTIYFKAFDRVEKKQKFKSASYDRIINDEASELPKGILQFQYRSMRNTIHLPRSIINLSNPGGDSTDYLVEHFVDGPNPYVALDWRDNPFIDKEAYEGSLNELDYIDQMYQKYGDWHYKPSSGDLINRDTLNQSILYSTFNKQHTLELQKRLHLSAIAIDMAGKGRDRFVATNLLLLRDGTMVREDSISIADAYPEDRIYNFVEDKCRKFRTYRLDFEREPGSDNLYSERYWKNLLQPLTRKYGVIIESVTPFASKYNRARPVAKAINNGELRLLYQKETDIMKDGLFDQFINISPNLDEMKNMKSPDELDSLGYAYNRLASFKSTGVKIS